MPRTGVHDVICTTCWQLRATGAHTDHCHCTYPTGQRTIAERERLLACRLCYVCGLAIVQGHTRWMSLLCDQCRPCAREVNTRHGWLVLPIGIHSIVNGVGFRANPEPLPAITLAQAVAFHDQLQATMDAVGAAHEYGHNLLRGRCERLGLTGTGDIDLDDYLAATASAGDTQERAWQDLLLLLDSADAGLWGQRPDPSG
jgi:hypothetical protein